MPRHHDSSPFGALQQVEHRTILVFKETPGDVNLIFGRDTHEVRVECSVMDAAEAQAIPNCRLALLSVGEDMSRVQQPNLL